MAGGNITTRVGTLKLRKGSTFKDRESLNAATTAGWPTLFGFMGFEFRLRYLAVGAALFALFKGCADDAAIASVFY